MGKDVASFAMIELWRDMADVGGRLPRPATAGSRGFPEPNASRVGHADTDAEPVYTGDEPTYTDVESDLA